MDAKFYSIDQPEFFKNNPLFTLGDDLQQFIAPLKSLQINFFTHQRSYRDGTRAKVSTASDWMEIFYKQRLFTYLLFDDPNRFQFSFNGYVLWSWLTRKPLYSSIEEYGFSNGLTIVQTQESYCDFFHFATSSKIKLSDDELIGRLEYLYRFVEYYKDAGRPFIQTAEKGRFYLSEPNIVNHTSQNNQCGRQIILKKPDSLFDDIAPKHFYINDDPDLYLTKRELEIINALLSGMSALKISEKLCISKRTVEVHIKHVKAKLNCDTLCQLGCKMGVLMRDKIISSGQDT